MQYENMETMEVMEKWDGYHAQRRSPRPANWDTQMSKFMQFMESVGRMDANSAIYALKESQGTANFPQLAADSLDRAVLTAYHATEHNLASIAANTQLVDFKEAKRFIRGKLNQSLPKVPEGGTYIEGEISQRQFVIQLDKYGKIIGLNWEVIINDDIGFFTGLPNDLATAARRTEEFNIASVLFDADGINAAFFAALGGQASQSTLDFNLANLKTAIGEMVAFTDPEDPDVPILTMPKFLVVGPNDMLEAMEALTSAERIATGDTDTTFGNRNVVRDFNLQLLVTEWLPLIATAKTGAWALIADPKNIAAIESATLRGKSGPELWVKDSNSQSVGGGSNPFDGSFEEDVIWWKVRHCHAAAQRDPVGIWGSAGAA